MYDDESVTEQAVDGRAARMQDWIALDNKVRDLEKRQAEAAAQLGELRPKRDRLGQQIAEIVYPSQKACTEPTGDLDW